jgi:L-alanine-DL-glutamate epimerase-like enolase superfamily enzyme
MRVGMLADAFGLECTPHNWGNVLDLAVHFYLESALPNAYWFEMPHSAECAAVPSEGGPYFSVRATLSA